ncbi:MAG: ABC-F family ATP-binding cassette domain-containing protein [Corynebacterium sp.]|nr:ABC-F family ATP-binding cassette domain-containing protein [Corynebacterium sp.]
MAHHHFKLDGVSFSYPGSFQRILTDVSLTVSEHQVAGLIGENGAGKSTTLAIAAGRISPDVGHIHAPDRVGYLPQEVELSMDATVGELIDQAVDEVRSIEREITTLAEQVGTHPDSAQLAQAYDAALAKADFYQLWALEPRIDSILDHLSVGTLNRQARIREISGGQRRRLALAMLLIEPHDGLIIDEPTNHLDDAGSDFVAAELARFTGPVIVASHDRYFLDTVATTIIDLDPGLSAEGGWGSDTVQGLSYTGSYSDYLRHRTESRRRWRALYNEQENERAHLEKRAHQSSDDVFHHTEAKSEAHRAAKFFADRAAKTVGNRIRSAQHKLENLERSALPAPPPQLRFLGVDTSEVTLTRDAEPVISLLDVAVEERLSPTDLDIFDREHILIEGPNGAGKSTLLSVIAGLEAFSEGMVSISEGLRVGFLPQDDEWTDLAMSAERTYALRVPAGAPSLVELGLLSEELARMPMRMLSLGQRRRVAIGIVLATPPDILLLDEPTNHISLSLNEDLAQAIDAFPGIVIVASHDRWIRTTWTGRRVTLLPEVGVV